MNQRSTRKRQETRDRRHVPCPLSLVSSASITLVELLVVLGIVAAIVVMSVPALTGYAKQLRLKTSIRQTMGLISLARSMAISSHQEHAVVIDAAHSEIRVLNKGSGEELEHVVRLPSSVTVTLLIGGEPAAETQFVFRPTGALAGRTVSVVIADQQKQQAITVIGTTGAVMVQ